MASPDAAMANFELPQASIGRIIKQALPANMQVSREAKLAFSKSASIFVLYLTSAYVHCMPARGPSGGARPA